MARNMVLTYLHQLDPGDLPFFSLRHPPPGTQLSDEFFSTTISKNLQIDVDIHDVGDDDFIKNKRLHTRPGKR